MLPVAAASGWYARGRSRDPDEPAAPVNADYLRGISHLVNDDADRAIAAFVRLLDVDNDTAETHIALGNLFRRQGEVDRALRVHQNLVARPNLKAAHRNQARYELAQDYLRAGVLDRAERLFGDLSDDDVHGQQSLSRLLGIHEQTREWQSAIQVADRLFAETDETLATLIGQYHCELTAVEVCSMWGRSVVLQQCQARRIDNQLTIRSEIDQFLESKLEGLVYVPDNFALTIQSAKRMYGSLISAATAPAIFVRAEEGIS